MVEPNFDEYDLGDDVSAQVQRPKREPGMVVSVRLDRRDATRLLEAAADAEVTVSHLARTAIRTYLDATVTLTTASAWVMPATSMFSRKDMALYVPTTVHTYAASTAKQRGTRPLGPGVTALPFPDTVEPTQKAV